MGKLTATSTRISWVLAVVLLARLTGAFLPNNAGVSLPVTDYTLTEITVQGIVRTVARYFEETNPDRYSKGDLIGLDPLTASRLFREHYGDCVYSSKFERAIKAILDANVQISKDYSHKAVWHFNGNQINKGNRKMVGIRNTLLTLLLAGDENAPDYDVARQYCGQFLHLAHSFYSNTNWIELNRWLNSLSGQNPNKIVTSSELGIFAPLSWRQSPGSVDMCQNCPGSNSLPGLQDCSDNLRPYVYYLTSGYRSGQDMVKPAADPEGTWGKCSHGGRYDASWTEVATGGINKESTDETMTPHFPLHEQAALTAIQATEEFFYHPAKGLYNLIGERKFRRLLNLDVGTSLSFVIDVSGSMSDDIKAVKEETINLVRKHNQTCLAASKYIIAPFSDPRIGPAVVTADAGECIEYLDRLEAGGGGDCPELANSGLEIGIQNSIIGANVYMFTDATDKDKHKVPDVLALIEEKKVKVKFLLTGTCNSGRRRKRATDWSKISQSYKTIADASGGDIYRTNKNGIRNLTRIIEGDIRASEVTIIQRTSTNQDSLDVEIPVDSTALEILVSVVGSLKDSTVNLTNPEGMTGSPGELGANVYTSSNAQIVFSINTADLNTKGMWVLKLRGLDRTVEYKVKVSANSPLQFTLVLLETDESDGSAYPIGGKPVAGAEVILMIQVSAPESVSSVNEIRLYSATGEATLLTAKAEPVTGRTEGLYTADITLPNEPFFVSIVGRDTQSRTSLRTQPSVIAVVEYKLEQVPGSNTIGDLVPGGTGNFTFRITNSGPTDTFTVTVSVLETASTPALMVKTDPVTAEVDATSLDLTTGETGEGMVTVTAAENAVPGTSVKVTLSVKSLSSSSLNFLSLYATVFAVQNDTEDDNVDSDDHTAPNCTIVSSGGGCTADQMSNDVCQDHSWWVRARGMDNAILTEIALDPEIANVSDGNGRQSLVYEVFSPNEVTFKYTASCCCPIVMFTVRDGAGKEASCGKDHYTSLSGKVDKPSCNGPIPVKSGLSIGLIVGIAVGAVALGIGVVGALIFFIGKSSAGGKGGGRGSRSVTPLAVEPVDTKPMSFENPVMNNNDYTQYQQKM